MSKIVLEICVDSLDSAEAAISAGADRLELCSALPQDGLSPSPALCKAVKKMTGSAIPVFCMVRPRDGHFVYSESEAELMVDEAKDLVKAGADGLVFGALIHHGTIDVQLCKQIIQASHDLPCTFHKAFDLCSDLTSSMETIYDLGFKRILSSGGAASALEGMDAIQSLVSHSKDRISIMAGGGIRSGNCKHIVDSTKVKEIHSAAKVQVEYSYIGGELPPAKRWVVSQDEVRNIKKALVA